MNNAIIQTKGVSVSFGSNEVLRNISLTVNKGEIVALIGPNGSGKSTLIKAILGLVDYSGEIKILNQPTKKILGRIGYVPQHFAFDKTFPLTVVEFLTLSCSKQTITNIPHALKEVEMSRQSDQLLGELSGGQLQRVLIARALLNQPEILFLDEPTTGIDIEGEKDFYEIISHQNKEHGVTIVMISHEINMVYKFATQIICLNKDLLCMGAPKDTITDEVLRQLYGEQVEITKHTH